MNWMVSYVVQRKRDLFITRYGIEVIDILPVEWVLRENKKVTNVMSIIILHAMEISKNQAKRLKGIL